MEISSWNFLGVISDYHSSYMVHSYDTVHMAHEPKHYSQIHLMLFCWVGNFCTVNIYVRNRSGFHTLQQLPLHSGNFAADSQGSGSAYGCLCGPGVPGTNSQITLFLWCIEDHRHQQRTAETGWRHRIWDKIHLGQLTCMQKLLACYSSSWGYCKGSLML